MAGEARRVTKPNVERVLTGTITSHSHPGGTGSMDYPAGSGIPIVVSGSSWGTTISNGSANWNTAYNHSQAAHAPATAEQNVNADWDAESGDAQILNKPDIPVVSNLTYSSAWYENTDVPTKSAVYDKFESLGTGGGLSHPQIMSRISMGF